MNFRDALAADEYLPGAEEPRHSRATGLRQALDPTGAMSPSPPRPVARPAPSRVPRAVAPPPLDEGYGDDDAAPRWRRRWRRTRPPVGESALPKSRVPPIALRSIDANITRTGTQVMAWYQLSPQPWSFRGDGQREQLIQQIAFQLGELTGRWLHLRVTTRPYPVTTWARAFDENLDLVRGQPFTGAAAGRYNWADLVRHEMLATITDVAHTAGLALLDRGDLDQARWALRQGLAAEPVSELLYRDLCRVEYRAGDIGAISAIGEQIRMISEDLDVDPEPETTQLLQQMLDPRRRAGLAAAADPGGARRVVTDGAGRAW